MIIDYSISAYTHMHTSLWRHVFATEPALYSVWCRQAVSLTFIHLQQEHRAIKINHLKSILALPFSPAALLLSPFIFLSFSFWFLAWISSSKALLPSYSFVVSPSNNLFCVHKLLWFSASHSILGQRYKIFFILLKF